MTDYEFIKTQQEIERKRRKVLKLRKKNTKLLLEISIGVGVLFSILTLIGLLILLVATKNRDVAMTYFLIVGITFLLSVFTGIASTMYINHLEIIEEV